jgi:hypothetical protein
MQVRTLLPPQMKKKDKIEDSPRFKFLESALQDLKNGMDIHAFYSKYQDNPFFKQGDYLMLSNFIQESCQNSQKRRLKS